MNLPGGIEYKLINETGQPFMAIEGVFRTAVQSYETRQSTKPTGGQKGFHSYAIGSCVAELHTTKKGMVVCRVYLKANGAEEG